MLLPIAFSSFFSEIVFKPDELSARSLKRGDTIRPEEFFWYEDDFNCSPPVFNLLIVTFEEPHLFEEVPNVSSLTVWSVFMCRRSDFAPLILSNIMVLSFFVILKMDMVCLLTASSGRSVIYTDDFMLFLYEILSRLKRLVHFYMWVIEVISLMSFACLVVLLEPPLTFALFKMGWPSFSSQFIWLKCFVARFFYSICVKTSFSSSLSDSWIVIEPLLTY